MFKKKTRLYHRMIDTSACLKSLRSENDTPHYYLLNRSEPA